jgi:hypothetical protein
MSFVALPIKTAYRDSDGVATVDAQTLDLSRGKRRVAPAP